MRESEDWTKYPIELRQGDILLGTLTHQEQDMFWSFCDFTPTPAFEPYRELFKQEVELIDRDDIDGFENLYDQIGELNLSLFINNRIDEENAILLHILENEAWFRPLNS